MNQFLNAKEVAEILGRSENTARIRIKALNAELVKQGKRIERGLVNKKFFFEKYGIEEPVSL